MCAPQTAENCTAYTLDFIWLGVNNESCAPFHVKKEICRVRVSFAEEAVRRLSLNAFAPDAKNRAEMSHQAYSTIA